MSSLLPECSGALEGQPCIYIVSDKGAIVYGAHESCMHADMLLPGFNLLPDWLLSSALRRGWLELVLARAAQLINRNEPASGLDQSTIYLPHLHITIHSPIRCTGRAALNVSA
jgi:hypothetical protein